VRRGDRVALAAAGAAWALTAHAAVNCGLLRRPPRARFVAEPVSVLVPARNEAQRIRPVLKALLDQVGVPDIEILVLDDESTDGTADAVAAVAAAHPRGDAVRVMRGTPPPAGWMGKPHACAQLAAAARGQVLVFADADVLVTPDGVARAVTQLRTLGLDLVSPYPRQLAGSPLEVLVQPLLQWSWLTFLPLRLAERSARPSLAAANGQFLAVDAQAYRRAGGHSAVRTAVLEDIELLRAVKRSGGRGTVTDGTELATCRMYEGFRALRQGYRKSLWAAFGGELGGAAVTAVLLVLYALPWLAWRTSRWWFAAAAAGPAGRLVTARRTGGPPAAALLHPLSVIAFAGLFGDSVAGHRRGRLRWRDRPIPR
jgi:glycosyltransferase involved in cell wall biosynthesis